MSDLAAAVKALADEWNTRDFVRMPEDFAATLYALLASHGGASDAAWPCDNYLRPHTCLTVGLTQGECAHCTEVRRTADTTPEGERT